MAHLASTGQNLCAEVLGGALGYLGGSYASQPSYGHSYGQQSYYLGPVHIPLPPGI